jgi:hypothetical protein
VVRVRIEPNLDPLRWGCGTFLSRDRLNTAIGFPVCRATVNYSGEGYLGLLGWVQVVGTASADAMRWEPDPLALLRDLDLPFAFFGFAPTLFDTPVRADLSLPTIWTAHSFLCSVPGPVGDRIVRPVVGFEWGFRSSGADIAIEEPARLNLEAWDARLEMLQDRHPTWSFLHSGQSFTS